jgi:putative transposase
MYKDGLLPDNIYHIYNRGNNKEMIFKEPKNYVYFLSLWKKHIYPVTDSLAYSLQPNHFHFLIRTRDISADCDIQTKKINHSFSNFFNAYSKSIIQAYNRTGSLMQERFGRKMINNDAYFSKIIWHIHSNSQKHKIINDFRYYPYCSYQAILSTKPTLLLTDEVLDWFGSREEFIKFHEQDQMVSTCYLNNLKF